MDIGEKVALLRSRKGWSQQDLAKAIGGNVKQQNIQQLETGVVRQPRYLKRLAEVLGISFNDLLSSKPITINKGTVVTSDRPLPELDVAITEFALSALKVLYSADVRKLKGMTWEAERFIKLYRLGSLKPGIKLSDLEETKEYLEI